VLMGQLDQIENVRENSRSHWATGRPARTSCLANPAMRRSIDDQIRKLGHPTPTPPKPATLAVNRSSPGFPAYLRANMLLKFGAAIG
jgi:hypothetical protein